MNTPLPIELETEFSALLGDGWCTDMASRQAHGNDNSWRHSLPDAVAFPQDREQIVALVRTCRRHQVPLAVSYTHLDVYKRQRPSCRWGWRR